MSYMGLSSDLYIRWLFSEGKLPRDAKSKLKEQWSRLNQLNSSEGMDIFTPYAHNI